MIDKRIWLAAGVVAVLGAAPVWAQEERLVEDEVCDPLMEEDGDAVRTESGSVVRTVGSEACPVVAEVEAPAPVVEPVAPAAGPPEPEMVNFEFDESEIEPMYEDLLSQVANSLAQNPNARASLTGHTDAIGTEVYNLGLAERRVESVAQYLQARGVRPEQLSLQAEGEGEPIATNETERGRFLNRRVEIEMAG